MPALRRHGTLRMLHYEGTALSECRHYEGPVLSERRHYDGTVLVVQTFRSARFSSHDR